MSDIERNIIKDNETIEFINNLKKLDKNEIIDLVSDYFTQLKLEANMQNEYSRIKMTLLNSLKIYVKHQLNKK